MAKTKPKKPTSVILQHNTQPTLEIFDRNVMRGNQPPKYTDANQRQWAEEAFDLNTKLKLKERMILSAANTVIRDKAWLNVASCSNIYTQNPAIEFQNDRDDHFGGTVDCWLENLTGPKNLQFLIRISGSSTGNVTLTLGSSLPTITSLIPVTISGSMDMVIGSVLQIPSNSGDGLGLISLKVQFHNAEWAYWHFVDINITEVV